MRQASFSMCSSPLLLLLPCTSIFHITSSTSYLVEVEDADHHLAKVEDAVNSDHLAKPNPSIPKPPPKQPVKEDKKPENAAVNGSKNPPPVKEDTRAKDVAFNGHHIKNVTKYGVGQDYTESSHDTESSDESVSSKEDEDNSEKESDFDDDEDSSSEESESGSSEFKRKLNDPEYTVVL